MSSFLFNPPLANVSGLASQSTQQLRPVCTWSAHAPQCGLSESPSPFPRSHHTVTATATIAGELFLFGGYVPGCASSDLYVISTRDFSTTFLHTGGESPTPRALHGATLIGTTLWICGGVTNIDDQYVLNHDICLLNLVSRKWTRVVINGPGPGGRFCHTTTVVGSKLFIFGGRMGVKITNDMWTLDLNSPKSQPVWKFNEPAPGNKRPLPRYGHVSVTTGDRIIIFGGAGDQHYYNDTWSFDNSTGKWTELQCTGSFPSPRLGHATVLVDDVMYVFGGSSMDEDYLDNLYALQLSTQRWFKIHNVGPSPPGRSAHAMASDGTRVFVLGGFSKVAWAVELSLIHVFDTKDIKYPDPEHNSANLNEETTQPARKSSTRPPTHEQPQHPKSSSLEPHGASRLQNATPAVLGRSASLQITHERNRGPNGRPLELMGGNRKPRSVSEDDVGEGSTEYHAKLAAPYSSSEREVTRFELERQLSVSLAAQTERDKHITRLTDELALKSALLEQAKADAVEGQSDVEPVDIMLQARLEDMQEKLDTLEELLLSHDQQIRQYEKELANMRAKLGENESQLEAVRLRFMDAEYGWDKSEAKADKWHTIRAANLVDLNEDREMCDPEEGMQVMEAELVVPVSRERNKKSMEEMDRRNEG